MTGIMAAFVGTGGGTGVVSLVGGTYADNQVQPFGASVVYGLSNAGAESINISGAGSTPLGNWVVPTSAAALYECRFTINSGACSGSATGVWLPMTASYLWQVFKSGASAGNQTCNATVEIRLASSGVVKATHALSISATVT